MFNTSCNQTTYLWLLQGVLLFGVIKPFSTPVEEPKEVITFNVSCYEN